MSNPREEALKILFKIDYEGAYSNLALKDGLVGLSGQDRAFATRLVYGCVSMKITLDYIIGLYSSVKLKKLSKSVTEILRLGIYQLMYMDKVPASAAVNESVKLIKKYENSSRGFVNAILRKVADNKDNISFPEETLENLMVRFSFPKPLCEKIINEFGIEEAKRFIEALGEEPQTFIRANRLKISRDELIEKLSRNGVNSAPCADLKAAAIISGADIGSLDEFKKGYFTVQDIAAQLACRVLAPNKYEKVIDMCAAPGGKTTYLAELMENTGCILAFDIHPHKISLIEDSAERLGIDIINACAADMSVFKKTMTETADKILVDVPCSGVGIIRRKPDIKWNMEENGTLSKIQRALLENAISYLKPGGELVYSTCTVFKEENENIISSVLSEHDNIEAVDITDLLPEAFKKPSAREGYITLLPHVDGTDGFFICKLRKKK